jgi:hypothetical protein
MFLSNPKVNICVYGSMTLKLILSQLYPISLRATLIPPLHLSLDLQSGPLFRMLFEQIGLYMEHFRHACCIYNLSHHFDLITVVVFHNINRTDTVRLIPSPKIEYYIIFLHFYHFHAPIAHIKYMRSWDSN